MRLRFSAAALIFFLSGGGLFAQAGDAGTEKERYRVSVVPFRGAPDNIVTDFYAALGDVFASALPGFISEPVDMNNLPEDVPPTGQPAYVCPSPSITKDAPYALTGEVTLGEDAAYHLRLYLWDTADQRLIFSDETMAQTREECTDYLPAVLDWIFSWQAKEKATPEAPVPVEAPPPVKERIEKWLYLGLRGGGSLLRLNERTMKDPFLENIALSLPTITPDLNFYNINGAFHAAVHLFTLWNIQLDVQVEAIFTTDYAQFTYLDLDNKAVEPSPFKSMSLMFPLLARFSVREEILSFGIQGGIYYALPLGQMENNAFGGSFDYTMDLPLGYTAGFFFGLKAGPGSFFIDTRWAADLGEFQKNDGTSLYRRSMVLINVGYELGLINKVKKVKQPMDTANTPETQPDKPPDGEPNSDAEVVNES